MLPNSTFDRTAGSHSLAAAVNVDVGRHTLRYDLGRRFQYAPHPF